MDILEGPLFCLPHMAKFQPALRNVDRTTKCCLSWLSLATCSVFFTYFSLIFVISSCLCNFTSFFIHLSSSFFFCFLKSYVYCTIYYFVRNLPFLNNLSVFKIWMFLVHVSAPVTMLQRVWWVCPNPIFHISLICSAQICRR